VVGWEIETKLPGVREHERIVVHVHDPAVGRDALRDLMRVVDGGGPRP
jgi:hypothetical protein